MHARGYSDLVDYSVLGPLRVESLQGPVEIRGAKERLLLARLVAARGRLVAASELVDTLWDNEPPASAGKSLQTFVLRLRNALEPERNGSPALLLTEGPGYRLALDPAQVDAERFVRLAQIGERSLADGRPESAATALTDALALWRGPAYADFRGAGFAAAEARRLDELRLTATEDRLAAELALGRASAAVPELERLVGSTRCESGCGRCSSRLSTGRAARATPSAPTTAPVLCWPTSWVSTPGQGFAPSIRGCLRTTPPSARRPAGPSFLPDCVLPAPSSAARESWTACGLPGRTRCAEGRRPL